MLSVGSAVPDMEAVKKAASGAVDTIRNSPLFRRKFGTQNRAGSADDEEEPRPISPEHDRTPFVQGINFQVGFWHGCGGAPYLVIFSIPFLGPFPSYTSFPSVRPSLPPSLPARYGIWAAGGWIARWRRTMESRTRRCSSCGRRRERR